MRLEFALAAVTWSTYAGKGSNPEWNENFVFTVSDKATELLIKLLDSDTGSADDFVGEATYAYLLIHVYNPAITIVKSIVLESFQSKPS